MLRAFVNGVKIRAAKGLVGICECCNDVVYPFCGEIIINHWKHPKNSTCTFAGKGESEWHLSWKRNFPEEWQEQVFTDETTGEKHVADVYTKDGVTIEFQNSQISITELFQREGYYKKLIWVVNADGFDLSPVFFADKEIRKLYRSRHNAKAEIKAGNLREIDKLETNISALNRKLDFKTRDLNIAKGKLEALLTKQKEFEHKTDFSEYAGKLTKLPSLKEVQEYAESSFVANDEKKTYAQLGSQLKLLEAEMSADNYLLQEISHKSAGYTIAGENYTPLLSPEAQRVARAGYIEALYYMKTADVGTMFAHPQDVGPLKYLDYLLENVHTFTILLNTNKFVEAINSQQALRSNKVNLIRSELEAVLNNLREKVKERQREDLLYAQDSLGKAEEDYLATVDEHQYLKQKYELEIDALKYEIEDAGRSAFDGITQEKQRLTNLYKDKYKLNWKRKSKVWAEASAVIFLDYKGYLYRLLENDVARKYSYEKFIEYYKNPRPQ